LHNFVNKANHKIKKIVVYSFLFLVLILLYTVLVGTYFQTDKTSVSIELISNTNSTFQIFYDTSDKEVLFQEESSIRFPIIGLGRLEKVTLDIPLQNLTIFRLDLGDFQYTNVKIKHLEVGNNIQKISLNTTESLQFMQYNDISEPYLEDGFLVLNTIGTDPFIYFENLTINNQIDPKIKYAISISLSLITLIVLYRFVHLRSIYNLVAGLYSDRKLIFSLAKNDFKTKYAGSYFGVVWAFVQPLTTILVFWFVFEVGFRAAPIKDVPFVLWLMAGLIPWFFFADAWSSATGCFTEYSYLVKKVSFKISILPVIKLMSSLFVHFIFIMLMITIFSLFGVYPGVKIFQLAYFTFCIFVLVTSLSFVTASVVVFFKDLSQILGIVLQFGMWLTPIMWSIEMLPERFVWFFKLNPMYYVVMGYRESMLNGSWFFFNIKQTFYFWALCGTLFLIGSLVFRRLKSHFADVL